MLLVMYVSRLVNRGLGFALCGWSLCVSLISTDCFMWASPLIVHLHQLLLITRSLLIALSFVLCLSECCLQSPACLPCFSFLLSLCAHLRCSSDRWNPVHSLPPDSTTHHHGLLISGPCHALLLPHLTATSWITIRHRYFLDHRQTLPQPFVVHTCIPHVSDNKFLLHYLHLLPHPNLPLQYG